MGTQCWETEIRTRSWEHKLWRRGSKRVGKGDKPEGDKNGVLETRVWEDETKKVIEEPQEKYGDLSQGFGDGICMGYRGWDRI